MPDNDASPAPHPRTLGDRLTRLQAVGFAAGLLAGAALIWLPSTWSADQVDVEPGSLVIMMDRDQSVGEQRKKLIMEWEKLYEDNFPNADDFRVKIVEVPSSATAAHSQMVANAQASGGGVDVYSLDVTWIAEFAEADWLRPLRRAAIEELAFLAEPMAAGRYDGELWALPFNTDVPLLYYRKDLLDGRQPPETWAGMVEQTEDLWDGAVAAGAPLRAGYAGQFSDYEGLTVNFLEAVLAEDGGALEQDRWVEGGDAWSRALSRLAAGFAPPGEGGRQIILQSSLEHREDGSTEAFANGQVLFMRNWPVAYRQLTDGEEAPMTRKQVDVAPLPGVDQPGAGVLGGQSLAIAHGSDQPRAAQLLIEFLTSARSQEQLFVEGGFVPTQKVVYQDPEVLAEYPYLREIGEAVAAAEPRPIDPRYELVSEAVRRVVHPYLAEAVADPESRPVEEVARSLAEELGDARDGFLR